MAYYRLLDDEGRDCFLVHTSGLPKLSNLDSFIRKIKKDPGLEFWLVEGNSEEVGRIRILVISSSNKIEHIFGCGMYELYNEMYNKMYKNLSSKPSPPTVQYIPKDRSGSLIDNMVDPNLIFDQDSSDDSEHYESLYKKFEGDEEYHKEIAKYRVV